MRRRHRRWILNPYLRVGFALIALICLLAITAAVLWFTAEDADTSDLAIAPVVYEEAAEHREAEQASSPEAVKQETTLYENKLPDGTGEWSTDSAPRSGVLVAEEEQEDVDAGSGDTEEDSSIAEEEDAPVTAPVRNGRVILVGDSRTIDLFADSNEALHGAVHDGVSVYAGHAKGYNYFANTVSALSLTANDTLIVWMGANDDGNFTDYAAFYNNLLARGVGLILCTVGPTENGSLKDWDLPYYTNDKMQLYNRELTAWASSNGVAVIDMYTYISNNVRIDGEDGIHYLPRPNGAMWSYMLGFINTYTG